jgi:amino acid transporter
MGHAEETSGNGRRDRGLRRELRFWEAIALSIGIMAPGAAMGLNGVGVAANVGDRVPLMFVFATIGVLLVGYSFIKLTGYFSHAGSVYAFSGVTLGPRAGFFSGWALLGTYLAFTCASSAEVGLFLGEFFNGVGVLEGTDWLPIGIVSLAIVGTFAYGDIRVATRTLLSFEVVTVTLITILIVVIFAKIFAGDAPGGQDFTLDVFDPRGLDRSALGLAVVLAFLSWGGFEGAAALGEETDEPSRTIPLAIRRALIFAGIFYIICMLAQTLGFGADEEGVTAFSSAFSPLGDLGDDYVGNWFADLVNLGIAVSAFASSLGTATAGSRLLYALCRDGFLTPKLGETSQRFGSPANALAVVLAIALAGMIGMRLNDTNAVNAFFYPGTIGVLSLVVAYAVTVVGALRFLVLPRRISVVEGIVPLLGLVFLAYVLYKNLYPVPPYPYKWFPYVVGGWLLVGLATIVLVPGLARKIGTNLAADEGIRAGDARV